ncbi:MAG: hypothetical protein R3F56_01565 [Planctomycetota bacterium]
MASRAVALVPTVSSSRVPRAVRRFSPSLAWQLVSSVSGALGRVVPMSAAWLPMAGCVLSARPLDSVLAPAPAAPAVAFADDPTLPLPERAARLQAEVDRRLADAVQAHKATPTDVDLALAVAERAFEAADVRMQRAALSTTEQATTMDEVLAADDHVPDDVRAEILSLATTGRALAEQAAAASPERVAAHLQVALHLSLLAWANGPTRSLFAGYGPKLVAAIDKALALDPTFDGGAPLRLQGRFRGQAPWPYGDPALARTSLTRAVELAPVPVSRVFLGDVLWAAHDPDAARAQWQQATTAAPDASTRWSAPILQELARRRLAK